MTIASEITRINNNIAAAYTACNNKGATMPQTQNSANLATAINSIPSGGGSFIGIPREVKNGVYQMPTENFTFSLPNNVTTVGNSGLSYAFYGCTSLTSVDLSSLTTMSGSYSIGYAFYNCTGLTSVDLSSLTTVSGSYSLNYAFRGCTSLKSIDLSSLTTVGNSSLSYAFYGCTGLTSVDLSSLTTVSGSNGLSYAFYGCTGLTDIYFRALTTASFGSSYKNQFNRMMSSTGSTKTHTIHFPSNMESTISMLTSYPLFGGTSGYVVLSYDLPETS